MSTFIYGLPVTMDKIKSLGDFKSSTCKEFQGSWYISLVTLEMEKVQSISVIICLGSPSIFPDPTLIIYFYSSDMAFQLQYRKLSIFINLVYFMISTTLLVLRDAIHFKYNKLYLMTDICCKGLWCYSPIWNLEWIYP